MPEMLSEAHISRLENRYGICHEKVHDLAKMGVLCSVGQEEIKNLLGRECEGGGILIRYPCAEEMFAIRLDVPRPRKDKSGKVQKYDRPAGLPPRLFVPPGLDIQNMEEIWITEGELKALAGWAHGLPVCGLAGVYNWRRDVDESDPELAAAKLAGPGGKAPDPEALIDDLRRDWSGKKVALIYDSDINQNHPAWPAFPRLAEQLYALGAPEVKVVTLPHVEPGKEEDAGAKTGLDDYIRRRAAEGYDAAAELRELVRQAPEWVPSGGAVLNCIEKVGTLEGLQRYAAARLASKDPVQMTLGAAAYYVAKRETMLQAALKAAGIRGEMAQAVKADGKAEAERIRERQTPKWAPELAGPEAEKAGVERRPIAAAFPPAAEVLPEGFPFPDTGEKDSFFDIRDGRVVRVRVYYDKNGSEHEDETPVVDTVVLLVRRVDPVERDAGIEKWAVAWWERDRWRFADVPARFLFDRKRVGELVDVGLPVSSANVDDLIAWLHGLRVLAVLGRQDAPELPTVRAVCRCGWHELDGERFFVVGQEILRSGGEVAADAGDRDEIQQDAGGQTDADVRWAEDLSAMERQILSGFRCSGDPEEHKKFLLDAAARYPQVAFGLGCAAGAPLLRFVRAKGFIDVNGFSVFMVPRAGGRSRHQGKTTWNAVVASLYGWPGTGEAGRLRFADRTRAAAGVLFATNCDLTVHIEEFQHLTQASKKGSAEELAHLLHQLAHGSDRERAARSGGGRRTRSFHLVLFGTSEIDVTVKLPPETGAHERVLKLPPLLPEENDANRDEAERLTRLAMTHFGHAGREYLAWLVRRLAEEGDGAFIFEGYEDALEMLRGNLPTDARRASAGRIATRAAVGLCGLALLLETMIEDEEVWKRVINSFLDGWEMVVDAIPTETVAERAQEAVQAYIAANAEQIAGLRQQEERPPQRWAGTRTEVVDGEGRKVRVVALTETAFAEAVSREPFNLDPHHALQALASAGSLVTRTVKQPDGRVTTRLKLEVRVGGVKARCVCIREDLLDISATETMAPEADSDFYEDLPPEF